MDGIIQNQPNNFCTCVINKFNVIILLFCNVQQSIKCYLLFELLCFCFGLFQPWNSPMCSWLAIVRTMTLLLNEFVPLCFALILKHLQNDNNTKIIRPFYWTYGDSKHFVVCRQTVRFLQMSVAAGHCAEIHLAVFTFVGLFARMDTSMLLKCETKIPF